MYQKTRRKNKKLNLKIELAPLRLKNYFTPAPAKNQIDKKKARDIWKNLSQSDLDDC